MTLSAGEKQALLEWKQAGQDLMDATSGYWSKQAEIEGAVVYDLPNLNYSELKAAFQADIVSLKAAVDAAAADLTAKQAALP